MNLLSESELVDLQDRTFRFPKSGCEDTSNKNLTLLVARVFGSLFPDAFHCEPDILGSNCFAPRMGRQFQSLLSHPHRYLFHYLSQFFRRIVAYSARTALFYEPMYRGGRYLGFRQLCDRIRFGKSYI